MVSSEGPLGFDPIAEARRQWAAHGWDDVADGMAALTSVMRAQQLLLGRCDAVLADFDLTFARYELLALLSFTRHGELPLGKASVRLQVHPASVDDAGELVTPVEVRPQPVPPARRLQRLPGIRGVGLVRHEHGGRHGRQRHQDDDQEGHQRQAVPSQPAPEHERRGAPLRPRLSGGVCEGRQGRTPDRRRD